MRGSFFGGFLGSLLQPLITRVTVKTIAPLLFAGAVTVMWAVQWFRALDWWMQTLIVVLVIVMVARPWRRRGVAATTVAPIRPTREPIPGWLRRQVIERDRSICGICGFRVVDPADLHIDHIHPVHAGGTNDPGNLQVAHDDCNLRKGGAVGWQPPYRQESA